MKTASIDNRAATICLFVILHIAASNIAIYCIIAVLVYNLCENSNKLQRKVTKPKCNKIRTCKIR